MQVTVKLPSQCHARVEMAGARMDMLIADVSARVDERADASMAAASREASGLRRLADDLRWIMEADLEPAADSPFFLSIFRSLTQLASRIDVFMRAYGAFVAEHGALVEPAVATTIEVFAAWVRQQPDRLAALARRFYDRLDRELRDSAQEDLALCRDLEGASGDGLDDDR